MKRPHADPRPYVAAVLAALREAGHHDLAGRVYAYDDEAPIPPLFIIGCQDDDCSEYAVLEKACNIAYKSGTFSLDDLLGLDS